MLSDLIKHHINPFAFFPHAGYAQDRPIFHEVSLYSTQGMSVTSALINKHSRIFISMYCLVSRGCLPLFYELSFMKLFISLELLLHLMKIYHNTRNNRYEEQLISTCCYTVSVKHILWHILLTFNDIFANLFCFVFPSQGNDNLMFVSCFRFL